MLLSKIILVALTIGQCPPGGCPVPQQNFQFQGGGRNYAQEYNSGQPPEPQQPQLPTATPNPAIVRVGNQVGNGINWGSGTLVEVNPDTNTGVVVSVKHMFREGVGQIVVLFPDGKQYVGRDHAVSQDCDTSVIFIDMPNVQPIPFAEANPRPGEIVTSSGYGGDGIYGYNRGPTISYGSLESRYDSMSIGGVARSGDSGGPMLNQQGQLVGIVYGTNFTTHVDGTCCVTVKQFLARVRQRFRDRFARKTPAVDNPPLVQVNPQRPAVAPPLVETPPLVQANPQPPVAPPYQPPEKANPPNININVPTQPPPQVAAPAPPILQSPIVTAGRDFLDAKMIAALTAAGLPGMIAGVGVWLLHRKIDKRLAGQPSIITKIRERRKTREEKVDDDIAQRPGPTYRYDDETDNVAMPVSSTIRQTENVMVDRPLPEREGEAYREAVRRLTPQYGHRSMLFSSALELLENVKGQIFHGHKVATHTGTSSAWKPD